MTLIEITRGDSPLVLGLPHTGTLIPDDCLARLNENGRAMADTDWHIDRLYAGLAPQATTVRTLTHRYVIDANRDPSGASLYPGQNTTGLCPRTDFDGLPIYRDGEAPDAAEVERRRALWHAPYHVALQAELDRVRARHGFVILYDCHSIRARIPFLFDGMLPDFNIGTHSGASCAASIAAEMLHICRNAGGFTSVLNGRFKGGWTTRHYGQPAHGVHAVQMELAQAAYMLERPPWSYAEDRAETLRAPLKSILEFLTSWRPQ